MNYISIAVDGVSEVHKVAQAHRLDCEATAADCRFIVQSETEQEAVELAKNHMRDAHGKDYSDEELRSEHLKIV